MMDEADEAGVFIYVHEVSALPFVTLTEFDNIAVYVPGTKHCPIEDLPTEDVELNIRGLAMVIRKPTWINWLGAVASLWTRRHMEKRVISFAGKTFRTTDQMIYFVGS